MKILHTADWHMNTTLGRVDLGPHVVDALEQIAILLEEHEVDVMLVAGDLFSERSGSEKMRGAVGEIRRIFLPFLERGGTIIAIAGNHDSELFFETLRDAIKLAAPSGDGMGRLYLTATPDVLRLSDSTGVEIQFVLMPYPTPRCYLRGEAGSYASLEEKHRKVQEGFAQMLHLIQKTKIDDSLPSVLVSHVHISGAQGHTLYKIGEPEDVIFSPHDIPTGWAYAAYGHIHKPGEALANAPHIRYSGSPTPLDAAERDDQKSVALFEVGRAGRVGDVQLLRLRCVPFYQIEINDPDVEVPLLANRFPDAARALVHYTLRYQPDKHNLQAIQKAIETVFPNWYGRTLEKQNADVQSATILAARRSDVAGTVRDFLGERFKEHAEREAVLNLAEALLAEAGTPEL